MSGDDDTGDRIPFSELRIGGSIIRDETWMTFQYRIDLSVPRDQIRFMCGNRCVGVIVNLRTDTES